MPKAKIQNEESALSAPRFNDPDAARKWLEAQRWPDGQPVCVHCGCPDKVYRINAKKVGRKVLYCGVCEKQFSVTVGTIFEDSKVPLHKWLQAFYLLCSSKKGMSAHQLHRTLKVTYKTAWFMAHRIREACGNDLTVLRGIVEIDETYYGGNERAKHANKRRTDGGRGPIGKRAVLGMRERGGRTIAKPIGAVNAETLHAEIHRNVEMGSTLNTDTLAGYRGLGKDYCHLRVNHSRGEYARGDVTTNGIESVWAVFNRGMHGTYHHCADKNLGRYVNEFTFRLNDGNVTRHTMDRIDSLLGATVGPRLTYAGLTA